MFLVAKNHITTFFLLYGDERSDDDLVARNYRSVYWGLCSRVCV